MDIRVSNISLNMIDSDIRKLFSVYGVINSVEVSRNKFDGRSKGNAFVNMPIDAEARQAIVSLDKTMMDGKRISVDEFNASPQW
jgi:RNA recognition motif-containing protein